MRIFFALFFLIGASVSFSQNTNRIKLSKGSWKSVLELNAEDILPFDMTIKKGNLLVISNGKEEIIMEAATFSNDSIRVKFPFFNSELIFKAESKTKIKGVWANYNKGKNYRIPFVSVKQKSDRFSLANDKSESINIDGKWKVVFEPNTSGAYPALAIFDQKENNVSGTFLTETGDYRFLEGNSTKDSLYLSCFDGSHAFLFKAQLKNDSLWGDFFSGSHWQSEWVAARNSTYKLTDPDELTQVVDSQYFHFEMQTLEGEPFIFPNNAHKNKVVIVQIMGSWCPNCLDETQYYKTLYENYHDQGLEIISICYETGNSFDDYVANIKRLQSKLDLNFTFLVGGAANKGLASEHFKMLNEVISFPTSIFIGRDGIVKRVHTGFNGPGTGEYYKEYVEKTNALIESLLTN